ncbi:AMP-binding protein [Rugamonas sp. FT82W]|uniref:AMP-binding protein n=1 Tax=Duganella vulcania TaxID=2692166 RepID=A0A845FYV5_9BURK|nr:AMP-binding protein [Duganella vulcania]MYM86761.1 AMP-binding protein [Duganella vulcania]
MTNDHGSPLQRLCDYASADPSRPAFVMAKSGEVLSYAMLEERSRRVAGYLQHMGLKRGDHIAMLMVNGLDCPVVALAAQRSGLYYTPLNYRLTQGEIEFILRDCGATALVVSREVLDCAQIVARESPQLTVLLTTGDGSDAFVSLSSVYANGYYDETVLDECEGDMMLYSSGTTGRPKGVVRTASFAPWGTPTRSERMLLTMYRMDRGTVLLSPAPLYHAAPLGWAMAAIRSGATVVVMAKFDAVEALAAIEQYHVTHTLMVPTMFVRMLALPQAQRNLYDLASLRYVVHASAPCSVHVKRQMIEWLGPVIHEFYAGSEGNGCCVVSTEEWLAHPGTVGRALVGALHILDDDENEVPHGEVGMIYFSGLPPIEYHNDPEKSRSVLSKQGYTTLGDYGWVDQEGYLFIADRRTDLIISGGVNVYPRETEEVLAMHAAVFEVAVIGVPNPEFGQDVMAVVQLRPELHPSDQLRQDLIGFCRDNLAHYKCPKHLMFDELPRTETGKLLRRVLKEKYARAEGGTS